MAAPSHPFDLANISSTISRMSAGVHHGRGWVFDIHATSKRNWRPLSSEGDQSRIAVCIHCPQSCTAMHGCSTWAHSEDSLALASPNDASAVLAASSYESEVRLHPHQNTPRLNPNIKITFVSILCYCIMLFSFCWRAHWNDPDAWQTH